VKSEDVRANCLKNSDDLDETDLHTELVGFKRRANSLINNFKSASLVDFLKCVHADYSIKEQHWNSIKNIVTTKRERRFNKLFDINHDAKEADKYGISIKYRLKSPV